MFKNRRAFTRARTAVGLLVSASVLLVALGAVTTASAAPRVGTLTVAAQTGTPTAGTGGQATFVVTVAKGNTFSLTADLTVTGLPEGATASFTPSPQLVWGSFLPPGTTRTATLTVTTTAATPAGASTFTVKATRNTDTADSATGTGTLTVLAPAGNNQTITFAPLADKTVGDAPFTVSATASSGLPVSFAASGNCTVNVALVTLTGAGSCTITASQAGGGGSGFSAAPVARTFSIHAADAGIDLYAISGTTTIAGETIPVWGYNGTNSAVSRPGGPTLVVTEDQPVTISLHNQLGEKTALLVQGQSMIPDTTGVAPGGTKLYTFTPNRPGTYLYEAGLLPNAQHQTAMGLYGALVVQPHDSGGAPITTQAYTDPGTAFQNEAVLVLGEIDPALNSSADPATFDMRKYKPKYFLINGKAYPNTDPIAATGGSKVLLRYVNAGIDYHSMAVLGVHQTVIALDGNPLADSRRYVAETFGPGQTADAIVTAPAATASTNRLAIYDGNLLLHNSNAGGFGGMLTFLEVAAGSGGGDTAGPVTNGVAYSGGTLTAAVTDTGTGGSNVAGAEYFVDTVGAPGTGTAMAASNAPFDTPTEAVTATVTPALTGGSHTLYVRGRDSLGNWGTVSSVLVNGGDTTGPATKSPSLTPASANGTVPVAVHATGDDTASGGSNIAAAEYWIDSGAHVAMAVNAAAPIASLDATITAADVAALSPGTHVVSIRSRDAASPPNWGAPVTINLVRVDTTGPTVAPPGVVAAPNPNNGTLPINASSPAVRVTATLTSPSSTIAAAEAFLCTQPNIACAVGGNGTGIPLLAVDGTFNSLSEATYADIPLTTIIALGNGNYTIYGHGKDATGNWGATSSTTLVIDKIPPAIQSITRSDPSPTSATSVQFLVTFSEAVKGITAANLAVVSGSGSVGAAITSVTGSGATRTVTVTTGPGGGGTFGLNFISVTGITDLAGNALAPPTAGLPLVGEVYTQPSPPLYFSTAGNTNPPGVAGTADDADVFTWNGTAFSRTVDVTAITNPLPAGANVDGFDRVSDTQYYMSFAGTVTVPGIGTVEDEDVVFRNGTTWTLYFDGSSNGVAGTDLDAVSIIGGSLYFSTDNATVPPGAGGTGDDADIYVWNGGSSYTRVVDASGAGSLGLPGGANVDGFVRVDATHFYLSFSGDVTIPLPGPDLSVQDEDVAYYNAGTWSIYFNGTARGLTSGNLDVDAFDLP